MQDIINRGLQDTPAVGMGGAFYPRMWIGTHKDWVDKVAEVWDNCHQSREIEGIVTEPNDLFYPRQINQNGFRYLYQVDARGDLQSIAYTHEVIAKGGKE